MNAKEIHLLREQMRSFFLQGKTLNLSCRKSLLEGMLAYLRTHEASLYQALAADLGKSEPEAYLTEYRMVTDEIRLHLKKMKRWTRPKRVKTPLPLFPSQSIIMREPYGLCLIISPWNYPLQLSLVPLVSAISAGNCALLKCSPFAPATAAWVEQLVESCFPKDCVRCCYADSREADFQLTTQLLEISWDFIFFTGSSALGKVVMRAASNHLTPLCLELGGKSPCIVDKTAHISLAAKRIVWGKCINAGQTCVAPDYVWVHVQVKERFLTELQKAIEELYGPEPTESPYYPRIVNPAARDRLAELLEGQTLIRGQIPSADTLEMTPCIVDEPAWDSPLMQEEIFGPILPILSYTDLGEVISLLQQKEKPLALYVFADHRTAETVLRSLSSGGACVNDVILHLANPRLPFGGVGNSGTGDYHGKFGFERFTHAKSVLRSSVRIDLPFKYPPYKGFHWLKRLLNLF